MLFEVAIHLNTQSVAYLKLGLIFYDEWFALHFTISFYLPTCPFGVLWAKSKVSSHCFCSKPAENVALCLFVAMISAFNFNYCSAIPLLCPPILVCGTQKLFFCGQRFNLWCRGPAAKEFTTISQLGPCVLRVPDFVLLWQREVTLSLQGQPHSFWHMVGSESHSLVDAAVRLSCRSWLWQRSQWRHSSWQLDVSNKSWHQLSQCYVQIGTDDFFARQLQLICYTIWFNSTVCYWQLPLWHIMNR